jgi:hypothetical protein
MGAGVSAAATAALTAVMSNPAMAFYDGVVFLLPALKNGEKPNPFFLLLFLNLCNSIASYSSILPSVSF